MPYFMGLQRVRHDLVTEQQPRLGESENLIQGPRVRFGVKTGKMWMALLVGSGLGLVKGFLPESCRA